MKTKKILATVFAVILLVSCKDYKNEPVMENGNPPGQVTNITHVDYPGSSVITYDLPDDKDLLYIKAVYTLNTGVVREIKSSYYTNTMTLDGFGNAGNYPVALYSVNKSGVVSQPVITTISPMDSPIWDVFESVSVQNDFSGFYVTADNPTGEILAFEMLLKDEFGTWQSIEGFETKLTKVSRSRRGFTDYERDYHIRLTVRDRHMNYTDYKEYTVNPLVEKMLNKGKFAALSLATDTPRHSALSGNVASMWDNNYAPNGGYRWFTDAFDLLRGDDEMVTTFDLGVLVKLSRITIFNWGAPGASPADGKMYYYDEHLHKFELYGMVSPPTGGAANSWTFLGAFENIKPSGLPYGEETAYDKEMAVLGFEYAIPPEYSEHIRYLQLRVKETWSGTPMKHYGIAEIDVYGNEI
ncbi:hypothetical protein FACS1894159_00350 [Bacteroidia bacterium]|nr:hypothetical protein FACS1894159_00350 [Bacteroidia bacterium]